MDYDDLGNRMKCMERDATKYQAVIGMPLLARIDGRAFHTFTRGLRRPFDSRLTQLMVLTTAYLVKETCATVGYTQSDEISLAWYFPPNSESQYLFDGRYSKLNSILASLATGYFVRYLPGMIPEKADIIPSFDTRTWQVPTLDDAFEYFLWREKDAIKNSITMAASAYFSHKDLHGVSGTKKKQMLDELGAPWEKMPEAFKRGTYVKRFTEMRELTPEEIKKIPEQHRPKQTRIERSVVRPYEPPYLAEMTDKMELFR